MRTRLRHAPFVYYYYLVGIPYSAKPVRNYYYRAAFIEAVKIIYNLSLVVGIKRVGGLVKKDEVRVLVHGSGYQYSLLLPLAQAVPVMADFRVELQWQAHYVILNASRFRGFCHTLLVNVVVVNGNVPRD